MTRILLCLMLTACADTPRILADGAPVRPAPVEPITTYTPRGTGLPEYWGAPQPNVEPGPRPTRVLPETPDTRRLPGIWATKDPDGAPAVFDVLLPYPTEIPEHGPMLASLCAKAIATKLADAPVSPTAWPEAVRRCVVARLYVRCTDAQSRLYGAEKAAGETLIPAYEKLLKATNSRATSMKGEECVGVVTPPGIDAFTRGAEAIWDRETTEQIRLRGW